MIRPSGDAGSEVAASRGAALMPLCLVSLDEGPDVVVDRAVIVVGRHPQCDVRLDSIRISRRHCCMTPDQGDLVIRDLGSTNGIRINGQRVEMGRVRPGDEVSIAHIRFRLSSNLPQDATVAGLLDAPSPYRAPRSLGTVDSEPAQVHPSSYPDVMGPVSVPSAIPPTSRDENPLAAAVRGLLPSSLADRCKIQVILQMDPEESEVATDPDEPPPAPEIQASEPSPCPPDLSR
jgi:predicted component of type VI protein secretion system